MPSRILRTILTAAALFALLLPQSHASGFLHRSHTSIVDGAGRAVPLRGVNLGNWLYIEPWMIGDTHFAMYSGENGNPDEFEKAISDLVGPARTNAFYKSWRDNYITQADIAKIAALGFNSVRVPLDYRLFYDKNTGRDQDTGFVYLDRLLRWCSQSRLYVILDMHGVPGGKVGRISGSAFSDDKNGALLAHLWGRIAARYANNPWVGGYDLVNEPVVWDTPRLRGLYQALTTAVRAADKNHLIFIEGDQYGSRLDQLGLLKPEDVWDSNLALSDHVYGSSQAPDRPGADGHDSPYTRTSHNQLAAALDVPLWQGEFGYNSNTWNRRQRDLSEQASPVKLGWCYWAYKATGTWPLTSFPIPAAYERLRDSWGHGRGNPKAARMNGEGAFQALMALARGTAFGRCAPHKDVIDALTRSDFLTRRVPYQPGLRIPGRIPAMSYDMGAEGVAYHDTVSTDEAGKGPAGRPWNDGWNGRNDGVDLYPHPGIGDVIGGIQPGEWTDYTVSCTPGTCTLQIRYASPSGGRMHLQLNGADITPAIRLLPTGDWGKFRTQTVTGVKISARGHATLRFAFETDGFSLSDVAFAKAATSKK